MKDYDATEVAYKNGFGAGFAEGLAAAGIAPIQWRDAAKCPFKPESGTEYFVVLDGSTEWIWYAHGLPTENVRFWVPMVLPIEVSGETEETR